MTIQQQSQASDVDLSDNFLPRLTVSDTANNVLIYNNLVNSPTINIQSLTGFNSKTKLWLHCECTYANGYPGILTLAEAASIGVSTGETAFTCKLPLEQLAKLGDDTKITMILMISTDGTLNEHSLHVVRHHLEFRHNEASTNYSRWMTDSGPLIELLKIHELILPEAHNAGVDKEGSGFPGVRWGACQDKPFTNQLQGGMRVLDLRVYRHIDHAGTIKEFRLEHEGYHAGRYLHNCIQEVRQFSIQNPLEIVIMDFHEKVLPDAVNTVKDMLEAALSDRCIPWAARGLTIGQIRQQHPGRNIIIAWDDWEPARLYLWGKVYQTWNSRNFNTPTTLKNHMIEIMAKPPKNQLWSMLAAGYTPIGGPTRFTPNEIHWDYFFSSIGSGRYRTPTKGNMINIDFFASTGVVDRCISATRARALAAHKSTTLNFRAREVTDISTTLVWSKPEDSEQVEYYNLFIDGYAFKIENNEHTFHELTPGREYHYKVVAHFNSGDGNPSEIKVKNTDTTPPSKPVNLTASEIKARSTTLNWTPSTDNGAIAGYKIYRNTTPIDTTSATSYRDLNLAPLTNYRYIVQAFDLSGNETNSDPLDITTPEGIAPSKPNNLKASAVTANSIDLQWEASTDNVAVIGYDVLRNGDVIDRVTSTSFFDKGLVESTTYAHQIRALDAAGNFTNSEFLFTRTLDGMAPSKPTNLKALYIEGKDYLLWNSSTDNVKVVKYEIRRNTNLLGSTKHLDFDVQGFVTEDSFRPCTYIVRALDSNSNYSDSDPLRLPTLHPERPSKPGTPTFTSITGNSVKVIWTPSTDDHATIGYLVTINNGAAITVTDNEHTMTGLTEGSSYTIEVIAFDADGNNSDTSSASFTIQSLAPSKPGTPTFTNITHNTAKVTWSQSTDNVAVIGYSVSINNASPVTVGKNEHTFTGLSEANSYTVAVKALDAVGNASEPSSASFTTKLLAPGKPGIPQVSNITHSSAELRWAAASGLKVQYKIFLNRHLVAQTNNLSFTAAHLRSHTDYLVEVRAFNAAGESEPAAKAFKTLLAPPANLTFSHSNGRCRLRWSPVFRHFPSHEVTINDKVFPTGPGLWGYAFKLSELSPGPGPHHFRFKVRAQLDGATSKESLLEKTLTDGVPPTRPGDPVVSDITDTSATLTWEPASDNVGVTGYQVRLNGFLVFNTQTPNFTFTKLTSGAWHYASVRARDKDGNLSESSKNTTFKTIGTPPAPPPSAPQVRIKDETATSLSLEWGVLDGGSGVRILINDEFWKDVLILPGAIIMELLPNHEYTISVSKFDIYGQLSEPTILTHVLKDTTAPSVPGNLKMSDKTPDSVTLSWVASRDDVEVSGYVIDNNEVYFDSTQQTQYHVTGLMPGINSFEVRALDNSGNTSEPASILVEAGPPPGAPSNFRFTRGLIAKLEWDAPVEPVKRYDITLTGPQGNKLDYDSTTPILQPVLFPLTRYEVSITASNAAGKSLPLLAEITT